MPAAWRTTAFTPAGDVLFAQSMLLSALLWLVCWALCPRLWLALLLCLPTALLLPIELWLRIAHGTPITAQTVALVAESNGAESGNFLSAYGLPLGAMWLGWMVVYGAAVVAAYRQRTRWSHRSRQWVLAIALPLLAVLLWGLERNAPEAHLHASELLRDPDQAPWLHELETIFPLNVPVAVLHYQQQRHRLHTLQALLGERSLGTQLLHTDGPDVVVLVIGESASATRWGMLGYARDTTPQLQALDGVVAFSDVVALSSATRSAVPGAIASRPVLQPSGAVDVQGSPSLVRAFAEAGYRTHWISNQAPLGLHDTAISLYAQEAHSVRFLNPATYAHRTHYDEVLLPALAQALQAPGRHLVVLHLLGSHFDYALRYPAAFDHFQPSAQNRALPTPEHYHNSYDNSIRYTDDILARTIVLVAQRSSRSVVAYFSDHGVDATIGPCSSSHAVRSTAAAYRVPVAFWMGAAQRQHTPALWQQLQRHQHHPYTTAAVYDSLLELAGIHTQEPITASFLQPPQGAVRWVAGAGGRMVDFDAAIQQASCRIAMGGGTHSAAATSTHYAAVAVTQTTPPRHTP